MWVVLPWAESQPERKGEWELELNSSSHFSLLPVFGCDVTFAFCETVSLKCETKQTLAFVRDFITATCKEIKTPHTPLKFKS